MTFLWSVLIALVVMALGATQGGFIPFFAWAAGLILIVVQALAARTRALTTSINFDMVGVSEIVVVYGILGLLTNLGIGVLQARPYLAGSTDVFANPAILEPLLTRFGEGLLEAGIAPFTAVVLRQIDINTGPKKLVDVLVDPTALEEGFRRLELTLKGLNEELDSAVSKFSASSDRMADAAARMSAPLDGALSQLQSLRGSLETIANSATVAGDATKGMGNNAKEAAGLLAELNKVIASVRNFIRSDAA